MAGGKGKSIGGKATGAKDSSTKTQKSHSAKAGLQVSFTRINPTLGLIFLHHCIAIVENSMRS